MSVKRNRTGEAGKVLHVVKAEHVHYAFETIAEATALMKLLDKAKTLDFSVLRQALEFRFERIQDALALLKLLARARVRRQPTPPAVSVRQRPAMGYTAQPKARYESVEVTS